MKNTNNNFNITNEDALNFITALEYLADQLKQIDCPDFECNAYELLNDCTLTQMLRANVKPITEKDDDDEGLVIMKLKELKSVLRSNRGSVQFAIVYDSKTNTDIENGCSIDYAVEKHGDKEVVRIEAFENQLLITV